MFIMKLFCSHRFTTSMVLPVCLGERELLRVTIETLSKKIWLLGNIDGMSLLCYRNNIAVYCLFSIRLITNLTALLLNAAC